MGLFNSKKNQEEAPQPPRNPNTFFLIRLLAVGYLLWTVKSLFEMYFAGGEEAPPLWLLLLATVLFVGGSVWICITSWKQYKQMQADQAAAAAEEAERLQAEEAEALPEGEELEALPEEEPEEE